MSLHTFKKVVAPRSSGSVNVGSGTVRSCSHAMPPSLKPAAVSPRFTPARSRSAGVGKEAREKREISKTGTPLTSRARAAAAPHRGTW